MAGAIWDKGAKTPAIDWTTSASLEDVERSGQDVAEVTNLVDAVRAWLELDPPHRDRAVISIEKPIQLDGVATARFAGKTIAALAEHLPDR